MSAFLIKNGTVYDPICKTLEKRDIFIQDENIVSEISEESYDIIDAKDCFITTGFIDYHVHYFNHGTENGVNPDLASFPCGVTTAIDGGSCGVANYELYKNTVMANSDVQIFNILLTASGGQITDQYPERLELKYMDKKKIKKLIRKYGDNILGFKTRLSKEVIDEDAAKETLKATVKLAEETGKNVVVHVTNPAFDLEELCGMLRKGDVLCHVFQGKGTETILDKNGKLREGIWEAKRRGVLFDASNGCNNYDLDICQKALEQGFYPDIISSDVNYNNFYKQPLHSLPRIMSKYLEMGMSLTSVLNTVTINPATLIGRENLASVSPNTVADLVIFKLKEKKVSYTDVAGHYLEGHQVIVPQLTLQGGKIMYCQADFC